jgi:hypothetical protein
MRRLAINVVAVLSSGILLLLSPGFAIASSAPNPSVPEPSAMLVWAGIAGAGGVAYWWRQRSAK